MNRRMFDFRVGTRRMRGVLPLRAVKFGSFLALVLVLITGVLPAFSSPATARTPGLTIGIGVTSLSPIVALVAGILILVMPRLLNYIVAFYLIFVGLLGVLGR